MKYNELVAISGLSGLYQLISTKSDGAIVKNLDDQTTKFVPARLHNVTPLDSIEVFTETDNVRLFEVFLGFQKNEASAGAFEINGADQKAIKNHFGKLFPDYDKTRVYVSDMKKMIKWFAVLKKLDLLHEESNQEVVEEQVSTVESVVEVENAPAEKPKRATKKAKATVVEGEVETPKPKKKAKEKNS